MTLQEELEELYELKRMIESRVFQKYLAKPLREKEDSIKSDFFSDSLKESWKKGGKIDGIEEFFKLLKIDTDIKNKKDELEQS
jgi:hypothetical protein